ncbi:hypothetical protein HDU98_011515 [Podochytrium sp. JEL0797]|nr:hypothetical protein HDU98_011515 [Podochytrium sp. JEL0797]
MHGHVANPARGAPHATSAHSTTSAHSSITGSQLAALRGEISAAKTATLRTRLDLAKTTAECVALRTARDNCLLCSQRFADLNALSLMQPHDLAAALVQIAQLKALSAHVEARRQTELQQMREMVSLLDEIEQASARKDEKAKRKRCEVVAKKNKKSQPSPPPVTAPPPIVALPTQTAHAETNTLPKPEYTDAATDTSLDEMSCVVREDIPECPLASKEDNSMDQKHEEEIIELNQTTAIPEPSIPTHNIHPPPPPLPTPCMPPFSTPNTTFMPPHLAHHQPMFNPWMQPPPKMHHNGMPIFPGQVVVPLYQQQQHLQQQHQQIHQGVPQGIGMNSGLGFAQQIHFQQQQQQQYAHLAAAAAAPVVHHPLTGFVGNRMEVERVGLGQFGGSLAGGNGESTLMKTTAALYSIDEAFPDGKLECAVGTLALKSVNGQSGTGRLVMYDEASGDKILNLRLQRGTLKIVTCDESTVRLCVNLEDTEQGREIALRQQQQGGVGVDVSSFVYIVRAKSSEVAAEFVAKVRMVA